MPLPTMTPDEIVETLKHSSLPTILTEGSDDYLVFRRLEGRFSDIGASVLPVGGKPALLEIFNRRNEFPNIRISFVADRDMWLFSSVPAQFVANNFVLTNGYSIENDLYRDANLEALMTPEEKAAFDADCDSICRWFSFAVRKVLSAESPLSIFILRGCSWQMRSYARTLLRT